MKKRRRFFVPEVVQTSAMDCGPASLKALLDGHYIHASYGRLREACQTAVDGTSIDTIEEVAGQLGLDAHQVVVPVEHLISRAASALPAMIVTSMPNGLTHFVVLWSRVGPLLQLMDPGTGRRWLTAKQLERELYIFGTAVSATDWREWANSEEYLKVLRGELRGLGASRAESERLTLEALGDPHWKKLGALDACTRMVKRLSHEGAIPKGAAALTALRTFWAEAEATVGPEGSSLVPRTFWSVLPEANDATHVRIRGAVAISVRGPRAANVGASEAKGPLAQELLSAVRETPAQPLRKFVTLLIEDGRRWIVAATAALLLATAGGVGAGLLLRGLLDAGWSLRIPAQRIGAIVALAGFIAAWGLVSLAASIELRRLARRLELRMRVAFLDKIPRLSDSYFRSRPTSDMAERAHSVHMLRAIPAQAEAAIRLLIELFLTTAGLAWLNPNGLGTAVLLCLSTLAVPLAARTLLSERSLKFRTHVGALGRFYFDSLLGLVSIRSHGAERAIRREHETLLSEWGHSGLEVARAAVAVHAVQSLLSYLFCAVLLYDFLAHATSPAGGLLLIFWALRLPTLAQELTQLMIAWPLYRNVLLRLLEPLGAPDEHGPESAAPALEPTATGGVSITMKNVSVVAAGLKILEDVDLHLTPGEHVAIVGTSGAGKSTLAGLLLGLHHVASGALEVDGAPFGTRELESLRAHTAWVDPAVQLWNRSLIDNVTYGAEHAAGAGVQLLLHQAELMALLDTLPEGFQTSLGEGGGLVSGGEGQRVRFARALCRPDARLVILDEPFRGLQRDRRHELLSRARKLWSGATLICITHDIAETQLFERVLVVEGGRIAEDAAPKALLEKENSAYRALLTAETELGRSLWEAAAWRRWIMREGKIHE